MRGVQGEEYPIGQELFNQSYRMGEVLATPPPEPPTDEELWETGDDFFQANYYPTDAIKFARAVLKRLGKQ